MHTVTGALAGSLCTCGFLGGSTNVTSLAFGTLKGPSPNAISSAPRLFPGRHAARLNWLGIDKTSSLGRTAVQAGLDQVLWSFQLQQLFCFIL